MDLPRARGVCLVIFADGCNRAGKTRDAGCLRKWDVTTVLCSAGANLVGEDFNKKSCVPLPIGAVSWWPGDGNTDDIVGSNNGQLVSGAKFAPGAAGPSLGSPLRMAGSPSRRCYWRLFS